MMKTKKIGWLAILAFGFAGLVQLGGQESHGAPAHVVPEPKVMDIRDGN